MTSKFWNEWYSGQFSELDLAREWREGLHKLKESNAPGRAGDWGQTTVGADRTGAQGRPLKSCVALGALGVQFAAESV